MFLLRGREEAKETMGELLQVLDLVEHKRMGNFIHPV